MSTLIMVVVVLFSTFSSILSPLDDARFSTVLPIFLQLDQLTSIFGWPSQSAWDCSPAIQ